MIMPLSAKVLGHLKSVILHLSQRKIKGFLVFHYINILGYTHRAALAKALCQMLQQMDGQTEDILYIKFTSRMNLI